MAQQTLTVTLETVTPLFLGGAKQQPELRPTAFRGALRFWLRALLGGEYHNNLEKLKREESEVFGNTDRASPVVVRLGQLSKLQEVDFSSIVEGDSRSGLAYLFFSTRNSRYAISDNNTFDLTIKNRFGVNTNDAFKKVYASLWLMIHFGGLGLRVRRGAGAIQVVDVKKNLPEDLLQDLPSLTIKAKTPQELQEELIEGLQKIRTLITPSPVSISLPPDFDVLHPDVCRVGIVQQPFTNWKDALDEIGETFQSFRERRSPDYANVKNAVQGSSLPQPVERAAFGLPIVFFYSSLFRKYKDEFIQAGDSEKDAKRKASQKARATLEGEQYNRRASPLWIRPVKLANEKFAIIFIWFQAALLPKKGSRPEQLKLKKLGGNAFSNPANSTLVDTFLFGEDSEKYSALKNKGLELLEVTGW